MTPHLFVGISSHGYGHLAQVAPIINTLHDHRRDALTPAFNLTVRSGLPRAQIERRMSLPFVHDEGSDDFGMVMHDALHVDLVQSLKRYALVHQQWSHKVDQLAAHLENKNISCLVANAPYLTLAAARAAHIPAVAICSLNWADILEQCVSDYPGALQQADVSPATLTQILTQMRQAYASASVILRPEPAMQSSGLATMTINPLAQTPPRANRDRLWATVSEQLDQPPLEADKCWLILTSMGGIDLPLDARQWPTHCLGRRIIYLMAGKAPLECDHVVTLDFEEVGFSHLMASCDAVLTKPGYGMFVEARACCKPMLYIGRDKWPESPCLEQWAAHHCHAIRLTTQQVAHGTFETALNELLSRPTLPSICFTGAHQAAVEISKHLSIVT